MKRNFLSSAAILIFLGIIPFACRKSASTYYPPVTSIDSVHTSDHAERVAVNTQSVPFPETGVTGCSYAPDYGDSLLYPQPANGQDYVISPINNPGPGHYFSWPDGLALDSTTGAIDITQSETGERYVIGFVKQGSTDTCLQNIIIGGASYMDSIYVLDDNETKAPPYFNADPAVPSPCGSNSPGGPGCQWDVTGSAGNNKIIVDNNTGVIDLKKTLEGTGLLGGAFGLLPLNGQSTPVTSIYYRLDDASNYALQHINVQFYYYNSKSQIGPSLLGNILLKLNNIVDDLIITKSGNPRPVLIIITRYN